MSSKLPYRQVKIKLKNFKYDRKYKDHLGICNEGEKQDEIWINKNEPKPIRELTKRHELVHIRRQQEGIDKLGKIDEDETELEAIARCPYEYLTQGECILKGFLINHSKFGKKYKLSPNVPEDLKEIYKKIKFLLKNID